MEEQETIVIDVQLNEEDIASRLADINQKMQAVNAETKAMKAAIKDATAGIQENELALQDNSERLEQLKTDQEAVSEQYAQLGGQIAALTEEQTTQTEAFNAASQAAQDNAAALSELTQKEDELKLKQEEVGVEYQTVIQRIGELTTTQQELASTGQESSQAFSENAKELGDLKTRAEELVGTQKQLVTELDSLAQEINLTTQEQTKLDNAQSAANQTLAATTARLDSLKQKQSDCSAEMATYADEIQQVEQQNNQLNDSTEKYNDILTGATLAIADNTAKTKALKSEQQTLEGQIRSLTEKDRKYADSLKGMKAELSNLRDQYASLSAQERESAKGEDLLRHIAELDAKIKEVNYSMGDFHDNVGNYPGAVQPVTAQIKELTQALIEMRVAGQENTAEYQEMLQKVGELKDAMGDTQQEIKQMASDTSDLDSVMQGAQATAGLFSTALGVMNLVGDENSETAKEIAEAQKKLQSAIAITTGLQSVQNALQKNSALMMGIHKIQTLAAAKAQDAYTAATGRATVAQRIFNAVAKSNPYVLLAAVILSVVGALAAFTLGSKENKKQQEELNKEYESQVEILGRLSSMYDSVYQKNKKNIENSVALMKAQGKGLEEIRAEEDRLYQLEEDRIKKNEDLYADQLEHYDTYVSAMQKKEDDVIRYNNRVIELEARASGSLTANEEAELKRNKELLEVWGKQLDQFKAMVDVLSKIKQEREEFDNSVKTRDAARTAEDKKLQDDAAKKAKEIADKRREIEAKRIKEMEELQKAYHQFILDELNKQVEDYKRCQEADIAELQHRLDTERTLTISERAAINAEIIRKQKEMNEEIARMTRDAALVQREEQLRVEQQAIDDKLAQLKKEGVLTEEIRTQYEEQRKNNQVKYEEDIARIAEQYVDQVAEYRLNAEKETLENQEEELKQSYERREELRDIAAEKRLLEAGKDEEAIVAAELQNAIEEQAALLALDEQTKLALGMSQEQYELAVLQSEKRIQEAKEKTIQVEQKNVAMQMKAMGDIFGGMTDILGEFSEENEELAAVEKVLSLAKIAMSTGVAIAEGVASAASQPYPYNLVAIATTIATIMANIASAISTVKSAKFSEGGIVDGEKYNGDKIHAQLNSGEMVLNKEQQANLFRMINQPRLSENPMKFDQMVEAFSTALSEQPNPILDYTEFLQFTSDVESRTNKTIIQ